MLQNHVQEYFTDTKRDKKSTEKSIRREKKICLKKNPKQKFRVSRVVSKKILYQQNKPQKKKKKLEKRKEVVREERRLHT